MKISNGLVAVLFALTLSFEFEKCAASKKYNRYLAHIFNKYGAGGTMSFEGLEHLMFNLGLGELEFSPTHTIDEHHPNGYRIPDLLTQEDDTLQSLIDNQTLDLLSENDVQISLGKLGNRNNHGKASSGLPVVPVDNTNVADDVTARDQMENNVSLGGFKEMHDPKHRHPRHNDNDAADSIQLSASICLSPKSLLRLVIDHDDLHKRKLYRTANRDGDGGKNGNGNINDHNFEEEYNEFINNVKLTPVAFMKLCPALLAQIDQHVCMQPAPVLHVMDNSKTKYLFYAWLYASASIFILSCCGLLGILLVPLMKSVAYQEILKFLVAVAVGTLSGDALMHLLPHALISEHGEKTPIAEVERDHNGPVWICACAFLTAVFMYILESLLPLLKGDGGGHNHGHSHHNHNYSPRESPQVSEPPTADIKEVKEINIMLNEVQKDKKTASRPLTPIAFMVIIGDGLHNLTDGLAIGAAFASDPITGLATAFAVLCHELPHELGDFALLLQTGVSIRRAICLNIVSSVLSFVGMAIGILIAGVHSNMIKWIYAGTAGSFLYIAFSDLIPAMATEGKKDLKNSLIQITGILIGGVIMMLIALNEDDLRVLFE